MAIIESTATVLVRFTGLGIIVFNQEKHRGEIGIIRDNKHQLSIKIQEPRFKDGIDKDLIIYEDLFVYRDLPKEEVSIEIITKGNSAIEGAEIYQADEEFNRLESDDNNDFRWLVSMDSLSQDKTVVNREKSGYPLSKLYIEKGLFYVHKLDTDLFFEKIEKDKDGNELKREIYGNIAETIGVKIEADEVIFKIKIGDKEENHSLKKGQFPFRIDIQNMDYSENAVLSDMVDYQKYISNPKGVNFELEPVKPDSTQTSGGAINRDIFCHPIGGGFDIGSIDELE